MKKLLLHICCAPCASGAMLSLNKTILKTDFRLSFYWHNPNIWDAEEYGKRKNSALLYAANLNIDFLEYPNFIYGKGGERQIWADEKGKAVKNCAKCYKERLLKTALCAKENNFDFFSSSLLASPHQDHFLVKRIAEELSVSCNIEFLYFDFRPFFYEGKAEAKKKGCYFQKYCGCEFSFIDRFGKTSQKI